MNFEELIIKSVETFTFNATKQYKEFILREASKYVAGRNINEKAYKKWLKAILSKITNANKPGSMFLKEFKNAVSEGVFIDTTSQTVALDDRPAPQLEDLESFEKEIDAWLRMFEELSGKRPFRPPLSRGIDKYNNVRGVFDGLGSFVYTDGTVSSRYPKLEDLTKEDRDALAIRIDVHHRGLPGHDEIVALVKGG